MSAAGASAGRAAVESIAVALQRLVDGTPDEGTSYGDLLHRLGRRGYGFAMLLLAAPNLTPGPSLPGFSTIFGVPMLVLAIGMLIGVPSPRLPRVLAARHLTREKLARFMAKLVPIAARADRALRPRWFVLVDLSRLNGAWFALLAVLLVLPFPFVSLAAAAAALLIAVGLIAEDGLAIALGQAAAVASVVLYAIFGWVALRALDWV
jgi:hypothetical protein